MTKFQMKLTRFVRFIKKGGDCSPLLFLFFIALCLSNGLAILFEGGKNIVFVAIAVSPLVVVVIIALVSKLVYNWACKRFVACFALSILTTKTPYCDEREVLEKLRKLAIWLGRELKNADNIVGPGLKNSVIRKLKNEFWSMWRLAKAMGFPVFKSWKTHAQIKFVEGEF